MTERYCIPISRDSAIGKRPYFEKDTPVFEERNLLVFFLGRRVRVRSGGWQIDGRLLRFEAGYRTPCMLLLLGDDKSQLLIRGWSEVICYG